MTPDHIPVNHISASLDAQLLVNVSYIGCMQPGAQARSYQEAAHTRKQDSSIVNAVIQEVVHCGSCTYTRFCERDSTRSIEVDIEECEAAFRAMHPAVLGRQLQLCYLPLQ